MALIEDSEAGLWICDWAKELWFKTHVFPNNLNYTLSSFSLIGSIRYPDITCVSTLLKKEKIIVPDWYNRFLDFAVYLFLSTILVKQLKLNTYKFIPVYMCFGPFLRWSTFSQYYCSKVVLMLGGTPLFTNLTLHLRSSFC